MLSPWGMCTHGEVSKVEHQMSLQKSFLPLLYFEVLLHKPVLFLSAHWLCGWKRRKMESSSVYQQSTHERKNGFPCIVLCLCFSLHKKPKPNQPTKKPPLWHLQRSFLHTSILAMLIGLKLLTIPWTVIYILGSTGSLRTTAPCSFQHFSDWKTGLTLFEKVVPSVISFEIFQTSGLTYIYFKGTPNSVYYFCSPDPEDIKFHVAATGTSRGLFNVHDSHF